MYRAPPIGTELRNQWVQRIEQNTNDPMNVFHFLVCENHFQPSEITKKKDRNILQREAIPSILPSESCFGVQIVDRNINEANVIKNPNLITEFENAEK